MKVIRTHNYIKISDMQTQPGFNKPEDINGPMELFKQKSDGVSDIIKKWKKKRRPKTKIKLPYQKDGV